MIKGVHNYSEIGKLKKVLLHRIGVEVDGLVPDNFARLLFDDIPYLRVAQQEHDRFAGILRDNGVEVVYYVDETAKAVESPVYGEMNPGLLFSHLNCSGESWRSSAEFLGQEKWPHSTRL
jgi:arginine deiminase